MPLRTCLEGDNDIAMSQMLPDQQPDALSISAACLSRPTTSLKNSYDSEYNIIYVTGAGG